mmetsp:Transcript_8997/g.13259  ORF Transcript_8997/g.13259 Transcript_8997/m.13259 type:complete len:118 (+) Transcript_8997:1711-2064(+)
MLDLFASEATMLVYTKVSPLKNGPGKFTFLRPTSKSELNSLMLIESTLSGMELAPLPTSISHRDCSIPVPAPSVILAGGQKLKKSSLKKKTVGEHAQSKTDGGLEGALDGWAFTVWK